MPEFKIEGDSLRRESRFRMLSWGTVSLLVAITVFIFVLRFLGLTAGPEAGWLAVLAFLGALFGGCVLACREAMNYAERQMVLFWGTMRSSERGKDTLM